MSCKNYGFAPECFDQFLTHILLRVIRSWQDQSCYVNEAETESGHPPRASFGYLPLMWADTVAFCHFIPVHTLQKGQPLGPGDLAC